MSIRKVLLAVILMAVSPPLLTAANTATKADIEALRQELKLVVESYEKKLAELEQRLQEAEAVSDENTEKTQELAIEVSQQGNQQAANTYNPGIGLILNGRLQNSDTDIEFAIPGFTLAEETGPADDGFSLGESELNIKANIDDKFYASATLAFGEETEVEEAYLETIALPYGFSVKAGRIFSNIGYLAGRHAHTDDFSDRPLAYSALLGGRYGDDGIQVNWLAPTDLYWRSGFELYRGEAFPAAGAANKGKGSWTAYTHIGGDFSQSQSWRFGLSYLDAEVDRRETESSETFTGDSRLWMADFVWKWAPDGNPAIRNAVVQAEYLSRTEKGIFEDASLVSHQYDGKQEGWYLQGLYQFMPHWRLGLRYSEVEADALPIAFANSTLDNLGYTPKNTSLMLDWTNSEFSRLRLQYSLDKSQPETVNRWTLQYIMAFGAHAAHSF